MEWIFQNWLKYVILFQVRSVLPDDPEHVKLALPPMVHQALPGLIDEMGNIDLGHRVGAFEHENSAYRQSSQRLLCPQNRLRTPQAPEIEHSFTHPRPF
jgi:hypothetical protein